MTSSNEGYFKNFKYKILKTQVILFFIIVIINTKNFTCCNYTVDASTKEIKTPIYYIKIQKSENFLSDPSFENLQLFRRLGKLIKNIMKNNSNLEYASFYSPNLDINSILLNPIIISPSTDTTLKTELASNVYVYQQNYSNYIEYINKTLPVASNNITISADIFINNLNQVLFLDNKDQNKETFSKSSDNNSLQNSFDSKYSKIHIQSNIKHFLNSTFTYIPLDYAYAKATLSNTCFRCKAIFVPSKETISQISNHYNKSNQLSLTSFISNNSLIYGAFTNMYSSKDYLEYLSRFSNFKVIQNIVESVGLNFEKDILENYTNEIYWHLNFYPHGDGGLPEISGFATIKNPDMLLSKAEKYKELAKQIGVFVQLVNEKNNIYKISYFLFPQFSAYFCIHNNKLIFSTANFGVEKILENISKNAFSNFETMFKRNDYNIDAKLIDFVCINFENFNSQIQTYLQSPTMASYKIPPIPNFDIASELDKLEFLVYILNNIFELDINLTFKNKQN